MKTKIYIISLVSIFTLCCSTTIKENQGFADYYSKIKIIKLPFSFFCGFGDYKIPEDIDKDLVRKYLPQNMEIVGRIYEPDENVYLLYAYVGDILYPYLYIYNKDGKVIDSTYLHNKNCYCGSDEYMESNTHTIISMNRSITMIDTTKVFTIDTLDQVNPRKLKSTVISIEKIRIEKSGKIKRLKETKIEK